MTADRETTGGQSTGLRYYIGGEVDSSIVKQARDRLQHAPIHEHYHVSTSRKHLFECLKDEDNICKVVVDSWLAVSSQYN